MKRRESSLPENVSEPAWTPADVDDDYLAEELFLRAIASTYDKGLEKDFIERFAGAVSNLALPPQVRIFRLQIPAWFMVLHPLLTVRLMTMKYALRNPPTIETNANQISVTRRCRDLLNDVELGREMSVQAGRAARQLAVQCNWNVNQLRNAVVMRVVVVADKSQRQIEIRKPSKFLSAVTTSIGLFFVIFAAFIAMYGIGHSINCGTVDCVLIGTAQLSMIGFTLGLPPLQHCWTRIDLYKAASRCNA